MTHPSDLAIAGMSCPNEGNCDICMGSTVLTPENLCAPDPSCTTDPETAGSDCNLTLLHTLRQRRVGTANLTAVCNLNPRTATRPPSYPTAYSLTKLPLGLVGRVCKPGDNGTTANKDRSSVRQLRHHYDSSFWTIAHTFLSSIQPHTPWGMRY